MHSTAVRNPNSTPEDDRIKWMRVQEVFAQHYAHEEAERKEKADQPKQRTQKDRLGMT
jgi:hypothetical protein